MKIFWLTSDFSTIKRLQCLGTKLQNVALETRKNLGRSRRVHLLEHMFSLLFT